MQFPLHIIQIQTKWTLNSNCLKLNLLTFEQQLQQFVELTTQQPQQQAE